MPTAIQKITHRIHGQRRLLVPSIMLRRGYLETAHLRQIESETAHLHQIESEMQALRDQHSQTPPLTHDAIVRKLREKPNFGRGTMIEYFQHRRDIIENDSAFRDIMETRMAHLKAMKKNITQFKLNWHYAGERIRSACVGLCVHAEAMHQQLRELKKLCRNIENTWIN